jgi:hypothetical protein
MLWCEVISSVEWRIQMCVITSWGIKVIKVETHDAAEK